jgi:hypothetical protein
LSWTASSAPPTAKYHVFSCRVAPFEQITSTALTTTTYTDERFSAGGSGWTQYYKVRAISGDLSKWSDNYTNTESITVNRLIEKVTAGESHEFGFRLDQNRPNPFNPSTMIEFAVPYACYVTLRVYNISGQEVASLVEGDHAAGTFNATWDASGLPSGIYFYRLAAGEHVQIKNMVLLK